MHETEKAYHIKFVSGKKTGWVPKSMVEVYDWKENNMTAYETCMMDMPFWLYEKIGKK